MGASLNGWWWSIIKWDESMLVLMRVAIEWWWGDIARIHLYKILLVRMCVCVCVDTGANLMEGMFSGNLFFYSIVCLFVCRIRIKCKANTRARILLSLSPPHTYFSLISECMLPILLAPIFNLNLIVICMSVLVRI